MNPRFPVYIPSKGRFESRLTARAFDKIGVPYSVVVEEPEYRAYCQAVGKSRVIVLDASYQRDYDARCALEPGQSKGSGPARNFIWDHALAAGAAYHWVVDDNISKFFRLNYNLKTPVGDGTIFACMEEFCGRYTNVAMAGPNYFMFASRKSKMPPFNLNTRIYSCNLIRNDTGFRWRCRYNEDTDLSLRMLKAGWCTILFNAFLQRKSPTMTMKGGNTDELYQAGTDAKSKMIAAEHPDVATVVRRWGRVHHFVDYRPFKKNRLARVPGTALPSGVNDYGMRLLHVGEAANAA